MTTLDDVALTVAEPSTWTLLGLDTAGLSLVARRYRRSGVFA